MNHFWYDVLKEKYGNKIKLLLSDTDSFIYAVNTEDAYRDLYDLKEYMDLSSYNTNSPLQKYHNPMNKKVPGKFSAEKPEEVIKEVLALKPKMYSVLPKPLLKHGLTSHATAKCISKVAQKTITHQDYLDTLRNRETTIVMSNAIRSFSHQLYSVEIAKRGLSAYDDKKYVLTMVAILQLKASKHFVYFVSIAVVTFTLLKVRTDGWYTYTELWTL